MKRTYGPAEFSKLVGTTVRALHHYDRLGLLKPQRTPAGYRKYSAKDAESFQQIVALKFIGVPLKEIKKVLGRRVPTLTAIRTHRQLLATKRTLLDKTIEGLQQVERALEGGAEPNARLLRPIIEAIEMGSTSDGWSKDSGALIARKKQHLRGVSLDARAALHQEWVALFDEVAKILDQDPLGPVAQTLAHRSLHLLQKVTGVDPATLPGGVAGLYSRPIPNVDPRVMNFMQRALTGQHS